MPLHLLGKKSWNVYNQANIERVQRDEAEAAAQEAAEEERQQDNDAARRLAILRGETPPPLLTGNVPRDDDSTTLRRSTEHHSSRHGESSGRHHESHRKRKRHGEDDTDFEMRVARDRVGSSRGNESKDDNHHVNELSHKHAERSDAPIVDHAGHIDLFPEERERAVKEHEKRIRQDNRKYSEAEKESAKKKRDLDDQRMMRFSNAAGRDVSGELVKGHGPWYAGRNHHDEQGTGIENPRKDAFGREDRSRKSRDDQRIEANDPLAMMRRGAARVREVEKQRRNFNEEREKELRELRKEERRKEKRRRRHGDVPSHRTCDGDLKESSRDHGSSRHRTSENKRSSSRFDRKRDHERDRYERHRSPSRHSQHDSRHSNSAANGTNDRTNS